MTQDNNRRPTTPTPQPTPPRPSRDHEVIPDRAPPAPGRKLAPDTPPPPPPRKEGGGR